MTLQEFYTHVGGNLDEVLERLRKEDRIVKYVGLFLQDTTFPELEKSFANGDIETAFRSAHSMKGVAANLGFNNLATSSSELTEDLRPRSFTEHSAQLFEKVKTDYTTAVNAIKQII